MAVNSSTSQISASLFKAIIADSYTGSGQVNATKLQPDISGSFSLIHPTVWQDANNNIVVSFRGTADLNDLRADRQLVLGEQPDAVTQAKLYALQIIQEFPGEKIVFVGHSLGGIEAIAATSVALNAGRTSDTVSAVTLNSPGMNAEYLPGGGVDFPATNFVSTGDAISAVTKAAGLTVPGETIVLDVGGPSPTAQAFGLGLWSSAIDQEVAVLSGKSLFGYVPGGMQMATAILATQTLATGDNVLASHKASIFDAAFVGDTTVSDVRNSGLAAGATSLYDFLQAPENQHTTIGLVQNIGALAGLTKGFGEGTEVIVMPGITVVGSGADGELVQLLAKSDADWKSADISINGSGKISAVAVTNDDGSMETEKYAYTSDEVQVLIEKEMLTAEGELVDTKYTYDAAGVQTDADTTVTVPNKSTDGGVSSTSSTPIIGGQIGAVFGSSIGQALGGNNPFAKLAAGSALSAIGKTFGQSLDLYFNDTTGSVSFESAVGSSLNSLGGNLGSALLSQATGMVSGFLVAELDKLLGVDTSTLGGKLINLGGTTVVNQALTNITNGVALTTGLDGVALGANFINAIGDVANDNVPLTHEIGARESVGSAWRIAA